MTKLPRTILILLMCAFLFSANSSGEGRALTQAEVSRLKSLTRELIQEGFPSLNNETNGQKRKYRLKFYSIKDPQYFMESNFTWKRVLFGTPDYRIGVNPIIFDKGIPEDALKGVLAHELTHSQHYYEGSTIRTIIPIGVKVLKKKSRIKYERKTDSEVVLKGFGAELKAYRLWQYNLLTPEQLMRKKKEYLSPAEIDEIMMSMNRADLL